jgi:hypothetical protein
MNIFEVLKSIKRGGWYEIPSDIYSVSTETVDDIEARKKLTHLRNYWAKQNVDTVFEMRDPQEMPVWDKSILEMVIKPVIKVTISNGIIETFNPEK